LVFGKGEFPDYPDENWRFFDFCAFSERSVREFAFGLAGVPSMEG